MKDRGNMHITYLTLLCKCVAEDGGVGKRQHLLGARNNRILSRFTVAHILKVNTNAFRYFKVILHRMEYKMDLCGFK